jgi:hypothetical protein
VPTKVFLKSSSTSKALQTWPNAKKMTFVVRFLLPYLSFSYSRFRCHCNRKRGARTWLGHVKSLPEACKWITSLTDFIPHTFQFAKREIQLVDQSGQAVRLTLWGKQAENFTAPDEPVIAFKGVKVGDFGGRSLSMFSSASMTVNPDIPEAHSLRGW